MLRVRPVCPLGSCIRVRQTAIRRDSRWVHCVDPSRAPWNSGTTHGFNGRNTSQCVEVCVRDLSIVLFIYRLEPLYGGAPETCVSSMSQFFLETNSAAAATTCLGHFIVRSRGVPGQADKGRPPVGVLSDKIRDIRSHSLVIHGASIRIGCYRIQRSRQEECQRRSKKDATLRCLILAGNGSLEHHRNGPRHSRRRRRPLESNSSDQQGWQNHSSKSHHIRRPNSDLMDASRPRMRI
mmetsp:Transcript_514/g.1185  ORF Transcript_514/g.1185 Transcript_514/m.1185 type:complete len:237 (-) Transcript_514:43-753(-)